MQVTCQRCHELTLRNSKSISRDLSYETLCLLRNSLGSSEGGNGAAGDYLLHGKGSTHPHVHRSGLVSSFRLWIYDEMIEVPWCCLTLENTLSWPVSVFPFGLDMSASKLSAICWMKPETVTGTLSSLLSFVYLAIADKEQVTF